jgi:hypothetical protein
MHDLKKKSSSSFFCVSLEVDLTSGFHNSKMFCVGAKGQRASRAKLALLL